jgi:hypothetical protein
MCTVIFQEWNLYSREKFCITLFGIIKQSFFVDHFNPFNEFVGAVDRFMAHENSELKWLTQHFW